MFGFGLKVGGGERYGFQRPRRKRFVAKMHLFRCEDTFFSLRRCIFRCEDAGRISASAAAFAARSCRWAPGQRRRKGCTSQLGPVTAVLNVGYPGPSRAAAFFRRSLESAGSTLNRRFDKSTGSFCRTEPSRVLVAVPAINATERPLLQTYMISNEDVFF